MLNGEIEYLVLRTAMMDRVGYREFTTRSDTDAESRNRSCIVQWTP